MRASPGMRPNKDPANDISSFNKKNPALRLRPDLLSIKLQKTRFILLAAVDALPMHEAA